MRVRRYVEDGNNLGVEWEWTGTHSGPLPLPNGTTLPPTEHRVAGRAADFVTARNGKCTRSEL